MSKVKNPDGSPAAYKVSELKEKTVADKAKEKMINKGANKTSDAKKPASKTKKKAGK